jgi:hypothetical protein
MSVQANAGIVPLLADDCFLPNSCQFNIHQLSYNLMLYSHDTDDDDDDDDQSLQDYVIWSGEMQSHVQRN